MVLLQALWVCPHAMKPAAKITRREAVLDVGALIASCRSDPQVCRALKLTKYDKASTEELTRMRRVRLTDNATQMVVADQLHVWMTGDSRQGKGTVRECWQKAESGIATMVSKRLLPTYLVALQIVTVEQPWPAIVTQAQVQLGPRQILENLVCGAACFRRTMSHSAACRHQSSG